MSVKLYDKKVYQISLVSNNQLLVLLAGKERVIRLKSLDRFLERSESSFDSKISERKNINLFAVHPTTLILALAIKTRIFLYQIHSNPQPYPYTYLHELTSNQTISYLEILLFDINDNSEQFLCYGYSSTFVTYGINPTTSNVVLFKDKELILAASREQPNEILRILPVNSE